MGFSLYIEKGYKNIEVKVYVQKGPELKIFLIIDVVGYFNSCHPLLSYVISHFLLPIFTLVVPNCC
jgi:hypothetical protein